MTSVAPSPPSHSFPLRQPVAAPYRTGRFITVVVLVVSFIAMSFLQYATQTWHHKLVQNTGSEAKISNLDSFSLALLLGGFRGPLVMILWSSSESQKQTKDLEDFDSKIELIRLLQPEFDSVHIFQIWNKAYNISVQMANNSDKYATIVDALEYGYRVNSQHPNDLNILSSIGRVFFDKLGGSQEQQYYSARVERETFPDVRVIIPASQLKDFDRLLARAGVSDAVKRNNLTSQAQRLGAITLDKVTFDALRPALGEGVSFTAVAPQIMSDTGRRIRLDAILDLRGNLTPEAATKPELEFLHQFEPFSYGVSPIAIGCAYFKRCQVIKDDMHESGRELSDVVVDDRPAINTMNWAVKEWGWGRRAEMLALGKEIPLGLNYADERDATEMPTAQVSPSAPLPDRPAAQEAIFHYNQLPRIAAVAETEFRRHARNYPVSERMFQIDRQQLVAMSLTCKADRDYLSAMLMPVNDTGRTTLLANAARNYRLAMLQWEALTLKHEMPDDIVAKLLPPRTRLEDFVDGLFNQSISAFAASPQAITPMDRLVAQFTKFLEANPRDDFHHDDRIATERYFQRAFDRLVELGAAPLWPQ